MTEVLYGSALSQPSRAVHWLCKANDYPIQFKNINLGKDESRTEAFLQLSPIGKIPVLKDGDFVLTESTEILLNQLMVNLGRGTPSMEAALKEKYQVITDTFPILEFWLRHGNLYLVSATKPTVVDLSCYNEVVQLEVMGLLTNVDKDFPKCAAWLKRMKVRHFRRLAPIFEGHNLSLTHNVVPICLQDIPHHDEMLAPMGQFFRKFKLAVSKL
ncbi:hypothetical protein BBJ28_00002525 [Nothophytophthora sp. Chile5]|nr:hypothetical protein BBJ28_00002525 [Nothophytophthora sp. Chile5]